MYSDDEYLLFREVDFTIALRLKVTLNIALYSYTVYLLCQYISYLGPANSKGVDMRVTLLGH